MNGQQSSTESIRVSFPVEQDEIRHPSVTREELWCLPAGGDSFVIDNIPFYARDVSISDEILTEMKDGERWFCSVSKASPNSTVRTFARKDNVAPSLVSALEAFGGLIEKMEASPLIAVSFPPSADLAGALEYLDKESAAGNVAFEESSVRYR